MQTVTLPEIPVLYFSTKATLLTLHQHVGNVAKELYAEAAGLSLMPVGPIEWIYYGADGKPETEFTLEVVLPLENLPLSKKFKSKVIPAFKGLMEIHEGAWDQLMNTYQKLGKELAETGQQFNGVSREQYLVLDFKNGSNNLTNVIMGI